MIATQTNKQQGNKIMAIVKVSELSGKALDYAVAMCEGYSIEKSATVYWLTKTDGENIPINRYNPSQDWAIAGPIIERESMTVKYTGSLLEFCAYLKTGDGNFTELPPDFVQYANEPLIAAMRCYVASKMGEEIEIVQTICFKCVA